MSHDKFAIVTSSVGLTLLIDRTISFLTAFGLEALVFSNELWTRLPVGVVLATITLLILWCVWTALAAKADFGLLSGVHVLKDGLAQFTRGLRGKTSEPGSDAGDADDGDGQGKIGTLSQSRALREAFNRLRSRRPRAPASTIVNPTGTSGYFLPDVTVVEMGETDNNASEGAV